MLYKKKLDTCIDTNGIKIGVQLWRSRRDLNPRYPFGVHTISSRARYDHFDTAPNMVFSCELRYHTLFEGKCQENFFILLSVS